jgi:hypothetical protein
MSTRTKEEFMARFKGVPPHKVARAMTSLNHGINFNGCPKGHLADAWVRSEEGLGHMYGNIKNITLDQIEARIKELYEK